MKKRLVALLCFVAILISMTTFGTFSASAATWIRKEPAKDTDYSFVVIGDIQTLSWRDRKLGSTYVKYIFDWILENRESRKISYVFGLGDTIDTLSTWPEDGYDTSIANPGEWKIASAQFHRLDGIVPYLVVRGNHDDEAGYHKYICTPEYKNQMDEFFYNSSAPAIRGNSMSNSYRKITIGNHKYLMMALDFRADDDVIAWANDVISDHYDHKVMISVHAYLNAGGGFLSTNIGEPGVGDKNDGDLWHDWSQFKGRNLWDDLFSKHRNILAVMCGHVSITNPIVQTREGNNGNQVIEILVDPQKFDETEPSSLVLILNFKDAGAKVEFEYYSTIKDKYLGESNQFTLDLPKGYLPSYQTTKAPATTKPVTTTAEITEVNATTTVSVDTATGETTTTLASTSTSNETGGCTSSIGLTLTVACTIGTGLAAFALRKKENDE